MLCIKTIKSLSQNELEKLRNLIGTTADTTLYEMNNIIIYHDQKSNASNASNASNENSIIACIIIEANKDEAVTYVKFLFVKDGHRNQGIGENLLNMAKIITNCTLYVRLQNEDRMQFYYEKKGFEKIYIENSIIMKHSTTK